MPDLSANVCALIADVLASRRNDACGRPEVSPDSDLFADLGCDSLDIHTITCEIDEACAIEIPDRAMQRWERVADVVATVGELTTAIEQGR